jgi:hypothetical protein
LGRDLTRLETENAEIEKLKTEREDMIRQLTDLFKEKDDHNRRFMELKDEHLKI